MRAGRALTRARGLTMAPAGDGTSVAPAQRLAALLSTACLASANPVRTWLISLSSVGLLNPSAWAVGHGAGAVQAPPAQSSVLSQGHVLHSAVPF